MTYDETFKFKLRSDQLNKISTLAEQSNVSMAEVVRHAIDIIGAADVVIVPLVKQEREFIESICESVGVTPDNAIKMVLLSYKTLMDAPLWRLVKPVNEILDELMEVDDTNERE